MKFNKLPLNDSFLIYTEPFSDNRGSFSRLFCKNNLKQIGFEDEIVQINYSYTKEKGTVRGLHYQLPPKAEIKLVKCIKGRVLDVIVDMRKDSSTFFKWHGEELTVDNNKMIYVPKGFAHGFQTLEDDSELLYLHSSSYDVEFERSINFNDPLIKINWPLKVAAISQKDSTTEFLKDDFLGIKL